MNRHPLLKHIKWLLLAAWVYTLTFVFSNYWSKYASYNSVSSSFQAALVEKEQSFNKWLADSQKLETLILHKSHPAELDELQEQPFLLFIYKSGDVLDNPVFWSSNQVLPTAYHLAFFRTGSCVKYGSGQYELLKRTIKVAGQSYLVAGLIQLHTEFFIENGSLKKEYPGFNGLDDKMIISPTPTPYVIEGERGRALIYLSPQVPEPIYVFNSASFFIECLATLFLCLFISKFSSTLLLQGKVPSALLFFGICFFLLRISVLYYGFPIGLKQLSLFGMGKEGEIYKTDDLGKLIVNAALVFWASLFVTNHIVQILQFLRSFSQRIQHGITAIIVIAILIGHYFFVLVVIEIYLKFTVSFDLTNFLSLNYTTLLTLCILFLLCVCHFLLIKFAIAAMLLLLKNRLFFVLLILAVAGLVILSFFFRHPNTITLLFSLLWLLGFAAIAAGGKVKPVPTASGTSIIWLFVYAVSLSMLIGMLGNTQLKNRTQSLGKILLLQKDSTSEYLVKIATASLKKQDWPIILQKSTTGVRQSDSIKNSMVTTYFGGYLSRYKTSLYFFDGHDSIIQQEAGVSFESLNTLAMSQAVPTNVPGLSFFGESFDQFGYIIKLPVADKFSGLHVGTVFAVVRSVNNSNIKLAPELFRQLQDFAIDLPHGFSYGWYRNGILIEQYRNFPFPTTLPKNIAGRQSMWESETKSAYQIWLNAGSDMVLAITGQRRVPVGFISIMAYLFGAFLLFYVVLASIGFLVQGGALYKRIFQKNSFTLQNKIRLTVVGIMMLAFIIVAVVTISFYIQQFRTTNEERLSKTVQDISTELAKQLSDDNNLFQEQDNGIEIQNLLNKICEGQNVDANYFDTTGRLLASTFSIIYEKGVMSPMANPYAWWYLNHGQLYRYVSTEKIGKLSYSSIYQVLRNKYGKIYGFLQVPYFASQNELNQEISNFLIVLINIIAFVFLLSGSLAFWISGSITKSFNLIAAKMNQLRLSEKNERIEWTRNDEIGNLVNQYNNMVDQLEESAKMLARSERETAWREMARQVAHEIKNPLTPMKLSLQFLQKAINEKRADVSQISERVAGNLVGQIDHLSNIATEFSQFANLGNVHPVQMDLHSAINEVAMLYAHHDNIKIVWKSVQNTLPVYADKTQINRLFTNLFQNAIEAGNDKSDIEIAIDAKMQNGFIVISVKDNGKGIPPEVQPNIFIPNFTTKSSGTGLGLAICKAIVENVGGDIWFETSQQTGTCFFVRFPQMQV